MKLVIAMFPSHYL